MAFVGGRFWAVLAVSLIGVAIGAIVLLWLLGAAFVTWGFVRGLLAFGGLAIAFGWFYDRRRPPPLERI